MLSKMKLWIFLQIAIDVVLLLVICFYLIWDRKRQGTHRFQAISEESMALFSDSVSQMISESKKILDEAFEKLEIKKKEIDRSTRDADMVLLKLEEAVGGSRNAGDGVYDKYRQAARMADEGLSVSEISERANLPKGEVELILDLRKG